MSSASQSDSGKAWEYALARKCADIFTPDSPLVLNSPEKKARDAYGRLSAAERKRVDDAASEAAVFLRTHDDRFLRTAQIIMQSDNAGQQGDVRDIIAQTEDGPEIGISAKHRHDALKHPRLSDTKDFGKDWYGVPCSSEYWERVSPVFEDLRRRQEGGELWRDMPRKHEDCYLPVLRAFVEEVVNHAEAGRMMSYLLGTADFYKIIKENGSVSLSSFNMYGSLKWGSRINLPDAVISAGLKPNSKTTVDLVMNQGWQVSLRIHSAEREVIPSLKFDPRLVGSPNGLSRHEIPY